MCFTLFQKDIGWRKEAKRLIILMTDQTSHLALDSKLAGIVTPNDGNCHLKDNVYTRATDTVRIRKMFVIIISVLKRISTCTKEL